MGRAILAVLLSLICALPVAAERAQYGQVLLVGLARDNWNSRTGINDTMVCNVNGPDGFLSIRTGPGTSYKQARAFNRLAIVRVDTSERRGRWVRVLGAYRITTKDGWPQTHKNLPVQGWAHDGYLCSFIY